MVEISVLVATRNRPGLLRRCIESVLRQDFSDFEILVFDDQSEPGPVQAFLQPPVSDSRVRFQASDRNVGVVAARNHLMNWATGSILVILDDDAFLADAVSLSRIHDAMRSDQRVGIVATKIIDERAGRVRLLVPFNRRSRSTDPSIVDRQQLVASFMGGFHAIRREAFESCGGYDPQLVYGEEELDLAYRIIQAGYGVLYVPDAVAHHQPQPSVLGTSTNGLRSEMFYCTRNRILIVCRYLPLRYMAPHLALRLGLLGWFALREGRLGEFARGAAAGVKMLRGRRRTPLSKTALAYVKEHHGRLLY